MRPFSSLSKKKNKFCKDSSFNPNLKSIEIFLKEAKSMVWELSSSKALKLFSKAIMHLIPLDLILSRINSMISSVVADSFLTFFSS